MLSSEQSFSREAYVILHHDIPRAGCIAMANHGHTSIIDIIYPLHDTFCTYICYSHETVFLFYLSMRGRINTAYGNKIHCNFTTIPFYVTDSLRFLDKHISFAMFITW